jgi:hypothetical protein
LRKLFLLLPYLRDQGQYLFNLQHIRQSHLQLNHKKLPLQYWLLRCSSRAVPQMPLQLLDLREQQILPDLQRYYFKNYQLEDGTVHLYGGILR